LLLLFNKVWSGTEGLGEMQQSSLLQISERVEMKKGGDEQFKTGLPDSCSTVKGLYSKWGKILSTS